MILPLIPHSRPTLPDREGWSEVTRLLEPGWIADGPCVREFASRAAAVLGHPDGVAVSSGTTALELALAAVGAGPGRQVLIPAYACAALRCAVEAVGAAAVLVDCAPGSHGLCPEHARGLRNDRTAAVVVVHPFGEPVDLGPFLELGVPVIEDCAQCLGATSEGRAVGSRGVAAIGSFFATKMITTGHGGLVASSDGEVMARVRDLVEYDNRDTWRPRRSCRMSELQAALGLWQLDRLPEFVRRREEIARRYASTLESRGVVGYRDPGMGVVYRFTFRSQDADRAIGWLAERRIGARRPVYQPLGRYSAEVHAQAEAAHETVVSVPIYPSLTPEEEERVQIALAELPDGLLVRGTNGRAGS